ncbi:odorant receptor 67a isoform X4 [Drosophila sechellia]|uniref:odorant receptor 67a isoform X4 n=1 Tax=Drosophila sechellia TaxID=7238 RepID=UPI0013DE6995|nr:odorant receptor 67a isoform X4 [Drosophila sechellia]
MRANIPNKGTHEVIMQVIMHFDRLAKALREFDKWCSNGAEEDLNELRTLIVYHNQVLRLTSKMNDIFGVPLLLNLLNSSMLICNVGFQLTIGISLEYIGQQVLNILAALMEVYLICSLSQMLINAPCRLQYELSGVRYQIPENARPSSYASPETRLLECHSIPVHSLNGDHDHFHASIVQVLLRYSDDVSVKRFFNGFYCTVFK